MNNTRRQYDRPEMEVVQLNTTNGGVILASTVSANDSQFGNSSIWDTVGGGHN